MRIESAIAYLEVSNPEAREPIVELSGEEAPVVRRCSADLHVCYVVDAGDRYEYVQERHLLSQGADRDELHQIGLRNLRTLVAQRPGRVQPYLGTFAFFMGGDFEASVILLDDLWDGEFRQFVTAEYAAAIPARDMLAFCDSASVEGMAELHRIIERVQGGDHLLTNEIQVRRDGVWQPLRVPRA